MNSMKRQKDRTLKDELPRLVGTQYANWRRAEKIAPERVKWLSQSGNSLQFWMLLIVEEKSAAVKNIIS